MYVQKVYLTFILIANLDNWKFRFIYFFINNLNFDVFIEIETSLTCFILWQDFRNSFSNNAVLLTIK